MSEQNEGNVEYIGKYRQLENQRKALVTAEKGENWTVFDSGLRDLFADFNPTLPDPTYTLRDYLKESYKGKQDGIVLVEMGGPAKQLSKDISEFLPIKKSIGLTLNVGITEADKRGLLSKNEAVGHKIITGDMFSSKTKSQLKNELGGEKVDILIERMVGGLSTIPTDENWLYLNLNSWYELLNENGTMFVEVPFFSNFPKIREDYIKWIDQIEGANSKAIEVQNFASSAEYYKWKSFLRLKKLPGAPAHLPRLENIETKK